MEVDPQKPSLAVFLSIGFRAFFALGVLFSALAMGLWAAFWSAGVDVSVINPFGGFLFWHGHEFIMGFALAIVIGFLLTAVQNWTGLNTTTPFTLALLILSWIVARIAIILGNEWPAYLVLILAILPIISAAVIIARPIIKRKLWRNIFAPLALLMISLIDGGLIYSVINQQPLPSSLFFVAILFICVLISVIGGRVIPMFIANKLGIKKAVEPQLLFLLCILPLPLLMFVQLVAPFVGSDIFASLLCFCLVIGHGLRVIRWFHKAILLQPMLWSLWLFYACLPLGFLIMTFKAHVSFMGISMGSIALHVITVGAISGLIISMVSRVSLGHTGHAITHDKWIVTSFALLATSLLVRTLGLLILGFSPALITLSAALFSLAFGVIFIRFILIWLSPKV